jgi:hypothetical protein
MALDMPVIGLEGAQAVGAAEVVAIAGEVHPHG